MQSVGLIHMNGRLYDPKLHRFLQTDNYVQDPGNTQNYNSYGYVLNNPLKYTDPSGWLTEEQKAEEARKAQKRAEEQGAQSLAMANWFGQNSADGLTSQQWINLGGQGVNSQLYHSYVSQNRDAYNSGMNYAMQQIEQKGHLMQWLESAGVNYKDIPNMTSEQVLSLISKVPELAKFYNESGNFDIGVDLNSNDSYTTGSRKTGCGIMTFGKDAFESMLSLGTNIIHETGHAWDFHNFNTLQYDIYNNIDNTFKRYIIEFRTYNFELKYSLPAYNQSGVDGRNYYFNLIQNRGYNPLIFLNN